MEEESLRGSAPFRPYQLVVELKEPWPSAYAAAPDFPLGLQDVMLEALAAGKELGFSGVAPDEEHSVPGQRVLMFLRLAGSGYELTSAQVPEANVVPYVRALLAAAGTLPSPASFGGRPFPMQRAVLVCGHGGRDQRCGTGGCNMYQQLRQSPALKAAGIQVWKSTHIGGHKFAPTCFEVPSMRFWGRLNPRLAEEILLGRATPEVAEAHYRGFGGERSKTAH